jgi:hypothetical protein
VAKKPKNGARQKRARAYVRRLVKAGIVDPKTFNRGPGGKLTRSGVERAELLWDRLAEVVGNPTERPFHIYRPRSKANLRKAEQAVGINVSRLKGVKGVPIPVPRNAKPERIRFTKHGFSVHFQSGPVRKVEKRAFDPERLIRDPAGIGRRLEQTVPEHAAIVVRTGAGIVSPLEHGETLDQTLTRLTTRYGNWRQFLSGVEIIHPLNGDRPSRKERRRRQGRVRARRKSR